MSLASLPTFLIVPPVNFFAAACVGALLWRRRAGRVVLAAGLAGLGVFSLPAVSGSLIRGLETGLSLVPPAGHAPQAVVILSADEQAVFSGTSTVFDVGALTLERERAGAALARRTGLPVLVTGGRIHSQSTPLAAQMAASMAGDFGVNVQWQEPASIDTWENAVFSAALLRAAGVTSVFLVTHGWHMRRSEIAFRHAGLWVTAAPVALDAKPYWRASSFVPGAAAWLESYYAMHEYIGCVVYWLRARFS
jgi:uncharacterized SAM-binding protein YcdF (DUF218 family)